LIKYGIEFRSDYVPNFKEYPYDITAVVVIDFPQQLSHRYGAEFTSEERI